MIKIRDFAKIAQVATSTLRYYDEIGIFKPIHVDPETGYRFYAIDQLLRLNRILALKDLGLELTQIVALLDEEVSMEALQGMLRMRQAKLQQAIQAEQEQLARIEARLNYIELEGRKLAHEVVLKEVRPLRVVAGYTPVNGSRPNLFYTQALLARLKQHGIRTDGSVIYLYYESASETADFDVEVAVPVERDVTSLPHVSTGWDEGIAVRELPEVPTMASVLYHGSPYAIVEGYQALGTWIEVNGYTIIGPCRKICLRWSGDLSDHLTEIQFPVEMAP